MNERVSDLSPDCMAEIHDFALRTLLEANEVIRIFAAFHDEYTQQLGIRDKLRSEKPDIYDSDYVVELRKTWGPHLRDLIFKKPSDLSKGDSSSQRDHDA